MWGYAMASPPLSVLLSVCDVYLSKPWSYSFELFLIITRKLAYRPSSPSGKEAPVCFKGIIPKSGWVYRVVQKSKPQSFVHIFVILTDFQNFSTGAFCGKFVIKWLLNIPPHLNCVATLLVKCKICKIYHYLVNIWTRVWSLIFGPWCTTVSYSYVYLHRKSI